MNKLIVTLSAIFLFSQCQTNEQLRPVAQTRILMDTVVQIVVYHPTKTEKQLQKIINLAFQRMEQIDSLSNNYSDSSQVSFVNQNAAIKSIPVDTSLMKILRVSEEVSRQTDGNFDMTIGAIKKLWRFETDHPHVPGADSIQRNLELVNYKLVDFFDDKVKFRHSGINLDLGGIAKGYAIDEAIRIIKEAGVRDAMVNAGGDLRVISSELTRGKRRIWLRHPRKEGKFVGWFPLDQGSVATSGDYERYFFQDAVRYHHILDPKTGYPARKCVSVTVQTKNATIADALATAIFVMGPEKGMVFVKQMANTQALIIYQKNNKLNIVGSKDLLKKFNFAKDWKN